MPELVQPNAEDPGILEIKWTWLPFNLAIDNTLMKELDQRLHQEFKGTIPNFDVLSERVIDHCCELKPHFKGLRPALEAIRKVKWDERSTE